MKIFQNDRNLWIILFKVNLENFKWHLKGKNFKILHCYNLSNFAFWSSIFFKIFNLTPINFQKIINWPLKIFKIIILPLKFFKIYKLTPKFNFQIWSNKIKIYKSFPKMLTLKFFITPPKQKYWEMKGI